MIHWWTNIFREEEEGKSATASWIYLAWKRCCAGMGGGGGVAEKIGILCVPLEKSWLRPCRLLPKRIPISRLRVHERVAISLADEVCERAGKSVISACKRT